MLSTRRLLEPSSLAGLAVLMNLAIQLVPSEYHPYLIILTLLFAALAVILPEASIRLASELSDDQLSDIVCTLVVTKNEEGIRHFIKTAVPTCASGCPVLQQVNIKKAEG